MKNQAKLAALVSVLVLTLLCFVAIYVSPVFAATPSVEISNFSVELISGGQVGVETTVRISVNVSADSVANPTRYKDMATCQGKLKYYVIDSTWYRLGQDSTDYAVRDYEYPSNGPGAHAQMDWDASMEYTWTPYISGTHYIAAEVWGYASATDGSWPPNWVYDWVREYKYATIDITETVTSAWLEEGGFGVSAGDCQESYVFEDLVIRDDINQECSIGDHVIGVQIPSGTTVLGTGELAINYDGDRITIATPIDAVFSSPVTITVDGEPFLVFTLIVGRIPQ